MTKSGNYIFERSSSRWKSTKENLQLKALIRDSGTKLARRIILPHLPPMATCLNLISTLVIKGDQIVTGKNTRETKEKTRVTLANQENEL